MAANDTQIGGSHYKKGGEEHWDRAWRLKYDPFQYIVTKWVERWRDKGGIEDLKKAQHAIAKYIELVEADEKAKRDVKDDEALHGHEEDGVEGLPTTRVDLPPLDPNKPHKKLQTAGYHGGLPHG